MSATNLIQIVECPRDAMQGWHAFIPTAQKIEYLKQLMQVGFHTLDCVSFVSPKAIPQMADSHEVIKAISDTPSLSRLLAIVANERGAADACQYDRIDDIGYPFSISPTFQFKNANSTIDDSYERLKRITEMAAGHSKEMVVYISMAFGNPYSDIYSAALVIEWMEKIRALGISTFALADTVGVATPDEVSALTREVIASFPTCSIGAHLHSHPAKAMEKVKAAFNNGCRRFDSAIGGFGGCPMAGDALVGNIDTQQLLRWLEPHPPHSYNPLALTAVHEKVRQIFV